MFLEKNAKRNIPFAIYFTLVTLFCVLISGCYTLSPRAKEMLSLGDGDATGVPKLIEGLSDKDPDVRLAALKSIIKLGPQATKDALPEFIKLLTSFGSRDYNLPINTTPGSKESGYEYWGVKKSAMMEEIGRVEFQKVILKGDWSVMAWLIVAQEPTVEGIIVGFQEETLEEVIKAIGAVGSAAEPTVSALISFLHDIQSWQGEFWYGGKAFIYGGTMNPSCHPNQSWQKELGSPPGLYMCVSYYYLRVAAAEALGAIGILAKRALPDLKWALEDEKQRLNCGCGSQKAYDIIKEAISKIEAR